MEEKNSQIKSGKLRNFKLRFSKNKIPNYIESGVVLPDQLPESLKNVESKLSSQIHEKYDSIFRRGLIEYKSGTKAQKRTKYKAHEPDRFERKDESGDEIN